MAAIELTTPQTNLTRITLGDVSVWFSYTTPVAVLIEGERIVARNEWGTTTGRHLNEVDGGSKAAKANRVDHAVLLTMIEQHVA
jgi:hypothetical protein